MIKCDYSNKLSTHFGRKMTKSNLKSYWNLKIISDKIQSLKEEFLWRLSQPTNQRSSLFCCYANEVKKSRKTEKSRKSCKIWKYENIRALKWEDLKIDFPLCIGERTEKTEKNFFKFPHLLASHLLTKWKKFLAGKQIQIIIKW